MQKKLGLCQKEKERLLQIKDQMGSKIYHLAEDKVIAADRVKAIIMGQRDALQDQKAVSSFTRARGNLIFIGN